MRIASVFLSWTLVLGLLFGWLGWVDPGEGKASPLVNETGTGFTSSTDAWWDRGWPYRVLVTVGGQGVVEAQIDYSQVFNALGLNHALLDLRSIRVLPYTGGVPGTPLPYAESYSRMLEDAENPQIGWHSSGVYWSINDGEAEADTSRYSQGSGSLKAMVENWPGGYSYPGVELRIAINDARSDWSAYEVFLYDVWPQVNASALDQAPDLYWFKLYNACSGNPVTQGGPPLALDQWNYASVSLSPLDSCWPSDGLDLSEITRMEFHTRDNDTVNGNSGLWDDGDELTLWFDNLRLVDQDQGAIRWETLQGVNHYYVYFDVLRHEGHPLPDLLESLGAATLKGNVGKPEAGGYYHQVSGIAGSADMDIWAAPSVEKITPDMVTPVVSDTLRVYAARGEFEPFQIVIRSESDQNLGVSASSLTSEVDTIPAPTIHQVRYVNITTTGDHFDRKGLWPDPLWPIDQGDVVDFPAGQNQPLWFTIWVPWDASAGLYQGTVTVGKTQIPVELQVWDFSLPRQIHLDSEWGFGWSHIVHDVYQGYGDWECYWEMVEAFKQDFINHRLIPKGVAWPAGLNYPGGIEYDCNGDLDPDAWGDWDFATIGGKYIHGEDGFNDGYGFPTFLAFGPQSNWPPNSLPSSFCGVDRQGVLGSSAYQQKWKQYLNALDAYITSADYDKSAYYHIVNEPQTDEDYTIVRQISALTESAAPHLRQLISEQVEPAIYNYPGAKIDIWMPTISNYEPVKSQDRQQNYGEQVWWYYLYGDDPPLPNPILMSHPGIEARITPWLAWAERVDGLLHYSATDWSPNPWHEPNVTGKDNGDGFFFYPPRVNGANLDYCGQNGHRLVPSLRWEQLRDGMEDYEYLWLLAGGAPQIGVVNNADAFVAQIVGSRTLSSRVPSDLEATRKALAAAILGVPAQPSAEKIVTPQAVTAGGTLTYTLTYQHAGDAVTLIASDTVPSSTQVITAAGPGMVLVEGQQVDWEVGVTAGEIVTLTIQAYALADPGLVTNTAVFSSTEVVTREATVLILGEAMFLPMIRK
jgi:hypothetical protein